jgi:integration host factor subunit beta
MTKPELIDELAKVAGLTKQDSAAIVETVFDCITDALVKGNKVELRGFGRFRVRQHRARTGRNPKMNTLVQVPAKKVPHFKPGKRLRNLLNAPAHPVFVP